MKKYVSSNNLVTTNVDVKVEDDDQALLLLCPLSEFYESFIDTILYGRTSITLEDIKASLNSKELQKKATNYHGSNGSLDALGYKYRGQGRVLKVSKGDLMVMSRVLRDWLYVLQATLVEQCKSGSRGQVEKPMKKVEFLLEDSKTPETQPVMTSQFWSVHKRKGEESRHLKGILKRNPRVAWTGAATYKVRWSPVKAVTKQSNKRLIMLG
ncbi:hypothetical protein CRG98_042139 [Punica granatum]|uniref:Uncharacterized protein n=1 Tax=Punica granatum TaxID=22663 RepID=A0A2I0I0I4_PUNGR|nr:hypothetical protein CRG98_042139 [Punica granatum]